MCDRPSAWLPTPFASRRHARLGCPLSACVRRRTMTRATASRASRRPRGRPSRCARRPRVAGALPLSAARHTPRTAPDLACVTEASCIPQALTPPAPERSRMFMPLCGRAAHWPGPGAGALARMGRECSLPAAACLPWRGGARAAPRARQGVKRKREAMEAAPGPIAARVPPRGAAGAPPGAPAGMLERLDHLKCAVCLEFMVASHAMVPCGAPRLRPALAVGFPGLSGRACPRTLTWEAAPCVRCARGDTAPGAFHRGAGSCPGARDLRAACLPWPLLSALRSALQRSYSESGLAWHRASAERGAQTPLVAGGLPWALEESARGRAQRAEGSARAVRLLCER